MLAFGGGLCSLSTSSYYLTPTLQNDAVNVNCNGVYSLTAVVINVLHNLHSVTIIERKCPSESTAQ